jgi:hypothetical protein
VRIPCCCGACATAVRYLLHVVLHHILDRRCASLPLPGAEHTGSIYSVSVSIPEPCLLASAGDDETVCPLHHAILCMQHVTPFAFDVHRNSDQIRKQAALVT